MIPLFYFLDKETIFFSSSDVSKSDSTSSLTVLDDDDPQSGLKTTPLDPERLDKIVKTLRKEIGLLLLGIDVVIENNTNRYAIIDINAYPGNKICSFQWRIENRVQRRLNDQDRKKFSD